MSSFDPSLDNDFGPNVNFSNRERKERAARFLSAEQRRSP